jgi:hypothetical protein
VLGSPDKRTINKIELAPITVIEENNDSPITEKIRMKVELYRNNELLNKWDFYTGLTLHHLYFEGVPYIPPIKGAKGELPKEVPNVPYLMICYIDLSEMPNWLKKHNTCSDIGWVIRVFSNETIGFVKDTSKEDMERALKESWEIAEPGRAEKAKKSRAKFLIQQKKDKGEELTFEEEQLLNEERERKTFIQTEENIDKAINDKNAANKKLGPNVSAKKTDTKNAKDSKSVNSTVKQPVIGSLTQPSPNITKVDFNRPLPKADEHTSKYLKEFLEYCYQERVCILDCNLEQERSNIKINI